MNFVRSFSPRCLLVLCAFAGASYAQGDPREPTANNPQFAFTPAPNGTVNFPVVVIGQQASAQVQVAVGVVDTGNATRTLGIPGSPDCTVTAGFAFLQLSDTTPTPVDTLTISNDDNEDDPVGTIDLRCIAAVAPFTGTLTCEQTISSPPGGIQPPDITWDLDCPAGIAPDVAPTVTYTPTQDADGTAEGTPELTLTGSGTATGSILVNAAGQAGTGSVDLSCVGAGGTSITAGTPQTINTNGAQSALALQCTTGGAPAIGTLTCTETDSPGGAQRTRLFEVRCPATVVDTPPTITYNPVQDADGTAEGTTEVTLVGSGTATGSITVTAAGQSGAGSVSLSCVGAGGTSITAGTPQAIIANGAQTSLALQCTTGGAPAVGTLTCTETDSPGGAQRTRLFEVQCPATAVGDTPPTITYNPVQDADGTAEGTTEVTLVGSGTATGSITVNAAGQSGTGSVGLACVGAGGTSITAGTPQTINTNGAQTSLALQCTTGGAPAVGTLTCTETDSPGGAQRTRLFEVQCPATAAVDTPPTITYNPVQDANGNADGNAEVVLTGTGTATGSITVTAAGQAGAGSVGLACVGASGTSITAGTPQTINTNGAQTALALQCTTGGAPTVGTLTCTETDSPGGAQRTRLFEVQCPATAIVDTPPVLAYAPTITSTVNFTGVTTAGTTGNGLIEITPSGGSGAGPDATTTFGSCNLSGANPGSFSVTTALPLSFVGATIAKQNLNLTCTSAASPRTATLTCDESRDGVSTGATETWALNCPAGSTPVYSSAPGAGTTIEINTFYGQPDTAVLTVSNIGSAPLLVTPGGLSDPLSISPLGQQVIQPSGQFAFTIGCDANFVGTQQQVLVMSTNDPNNASVTYNVRCVVAAISIPTTSDYGRTLLVLMMLAIGLGFGYRRLRAH